MADAPLHVEIVAADRTVWSGDATMVVARTTEGDIGVLPDHAPVLSLMVDGVVEVNTDTNETWVAAVDAGFLSVADNRVSILSEHAEMSHEIDLEKAKAQLDRVHQAGELLNEAEASVEVRRAEARVRAVEQARQAN